MSIKDIIKKNEKIFNMCRKIDMKILTEISPEYASKYIYRKVFGKNLDLKNPKTYNEKLMWLKLYWREPLKSICADKYEVREFIKEKGEEECLNELYGVYDNAYDIKWDELPSKFVLKVNNTCGANIICDDKSKFDEKATKKKLNLWMKDKYYRIGAEIHYKNIKPRIVCEKYLDTDAGLLPIDYKLYCFSGIPKVIMICLERETGTPKYYLCDLEGNILPFNLTGQKAIESGLTKLELPKVTEEMCEISKNLSNQFPFVRMDFYEYNGRAIFGEMTFTPATCLDYNITEEGEKIMGEWIELPKKLI